MEQINIGEAVTVSVIRASAQPNFIFSLLPKVIGTIIVIGGLIVLVRWVYKVLNTRKNNIIINRGMI